MPEKRIIAVHLLNDFSGSPFVLRQSLEILVKEQYMVELFTATPSGHGFLSGIEGVVYRNIFYKWSRNRWITLVFYLYSQLHLFFKLLFRRRRAGIVYINSLLPFGAALAAWCRGIPVIYHIHEVSVKPILLKRFLTAMANRTAVMGLFVSRDVRERTAFRKKARVVYNALPADFIQQAMQHKKNSNEAFTILMICSLKVYKGVRQFINIAKELPQYRFNLVLNAADEDIARFFNGETLPGNIYLFPAQQNVHPFYAAASVVVNLSLPDQWVETFGMTILEAMYYKKPVIIPGVGGITELVTEGVEGYRVNPYDVNEVGERIRLLASCPVVYERMSVRAFRKAMQFSPSVFATGIKHVFAGRYSEPGTNTVAQLSLFERSAFGKKSINGKEQQWTLQ